MMYPGNDREWPYFFENTIVKEREWPITHTYNNHFALALSGPIETNSWFDGYCRDCDAISDIFVEDPSQSLSVVKFYIGEVGYDITFKDGKWKVPWFTEDKPLYVVSIPFQTETLDFYFTSEKDKYKGAINVKWKSMRFNNEKRDYFRSKKFDVEYSENFHLLYWNGMACNINLWPVK